MAQRADAVADLEQLFEVFRNHQNGGAGVAQLDQRTVNRCGRADIHAPGRVRGDQQFRLLEDFAAEDEFLQVAAGEAARRGMGAGGLYREGLDDAPRECLDSAMPNQSVVDHSLLLKRGQQPVVS